jgi:hypothetical protein
MEADKAMSRVQPTLSVDDLADHETGAPCSETTR